ncbi:hypothetical protein O0L34_g18793 [Tuta absoluta]|nr:hypothetical protein O0L34_g18793 [Tuta absoluta]
MKISILYKIISIIISFIFFGFTNQYPNNNTDIGDAFYEDVHEDEVKSLHTLRNVDGNTVVFRVVNGRKVNRSEVPYQAALMKKSESSDEYFEAVCGGTIIGPKKILTAAHCIEKNFSRSSCSKGKLTNKDFIGWMVVAGQFKHEWKEGDEGQGIKVHSAIYPSAYHFPQKDIALMFLEKKLIYNDDVQPVPTATKFIDYKLECNISGWGKLKHGKKAKYASHLKIATIKTHDLATCKTAFKDSETEVTNMKPAHEFICTDDLDAASMEGDSGGPLVCKNTGDPNEKGSKFGIVVGIVSGDEETGVEGFASYYTRVSAFSKFIASGATRLGERQFGSFFVVIVCYLFMVN